MTKQSQPPKRQTTEKSQGTSITSPSMESSSQPPEKSQETKPWETPQAPQPDSRRRGSAPRISDLLREIRAGFDLLRMMNGHGKSAQYVAWEKRYDDLVARIAVYDGEAEGE